MVAIRCRADDADVEFEPQRALRAMSLLVVFRRWRNLLFGQLKCFIVEDEVDVLLLAQQRTPMQRVGLEGDARDGGGATAASLGVVRVRALDLLLPAGQLGLGHHPMVGLASNELLGSLLLVVDEQLLTFSALAALFLFIVLLTDDEDEKRD